MCWRTVSEGKKNTDLKGIGKNGLYACICLRIPMTSHFSRSGNAGASVPHLPAICCCWPIGVFPWSDSISTHTRRVVRSAHYGSHQDRGTIINGLSSQKQRNFSGQNTSKWAGEITRSDSFSRWGGTTVCLLQGLVSYLCGCNHNILQKQLKG